MDLHSEDISPESWRTREVYAHYGLAMFMAQVLEHGIVNLAAWTGVRDGIITTLESCDADYAELFGLTIGKAKTKLLDRRPDVAQLEDMLRRAVRLRNFLAHQYFRQRSEAFRTEEGKTLMIEELRNAVAFFQEVDARLDPLTMEIVESMGLAERIPEAAEELRETGFGDPLPGL